MPVDRTPPKDPIEEDPPTIQYPKQRLAAVTRKRNEIDAYLKIPKPKYEEVNKLYSEYTEKVINFRSLCAIYLQDQKLVTERSKEFLAFRDWSKEQDTEINEFGERIQYWLSNKEKTLDQVNVEDSASNIATNVSKKTGGSKTSQTSELRLQLMQNKAKRLAEEEALEQKMKLEEEEEKRKIEAAQQTRKYEYNLKMIELQKQAAYEKHLERSLEEYEEQSRISSRHKKSIIKSRISFHWNEDNFPKDTIEKKDAISCKPKCNINSEDKTVADTLLIVAQNQVKASLPKNEPRNFDGNDPTKYQSFIQDFKSMIERYCDSDSDKLHYLEKYTSGLPLELVKSCRHRDPTQGYKKALEILDQEFGNERLIASSYLEKLHNWKSIKNEDGKALQEFQIFLMSCNNMMSDYTSLNQLNSPNEIKEMVMKLPYKLRDRWRSRLYQIQQSNRLENFDDFTNFVREQSALVNLALYGNIADKNERSTSKKGNTESKKKIFSTSVDSTKLQCVVCKKTNHRIDSCFFFKKKSYDDKKKFIIENKLCFSCLKAGHLSQDCKNPALCDVCKNKHPSIMHRNKEKNKKDEEKQDKDVKEDKKDSKNNKILEDEKAKSEGSQTQKAFSTLHGDTHSRKVHPAVSVKVRIQDSNKVELTYMGIDPYCGEVYMNEELLNKFELKGTPTTVTMTTMHGKDRPTKTKVVNNLEIMDLDENEYAVVPVVYSKSE